MSAYQGRLPVVTAYKVSSGNWSLSEFPFSPFSSLLKWSATKFYAPGLSTISMSNSWSNKNPSNQPRFRVILLQQSFESSMIRKDNNFHTKQIRTKFLKSKHNSIQFFLSGGVISVGMVKSSRSIAYYMGYSSCSLT